MVLDFVADVLGAFNAVIATSRNPITGSAAANVIFRAKLAVVARCRVIARHALAVAVALIVGANVTVVGAGSSGRLVASVEFFITTIRALAALAAGISVMDAAGSLAAMIGAVTEELVIAGVRIVRTMAFQIRTAVLVGADIVVVTVLIDSAFAIDRRVFALIVGFVANVSRALDAVIAGFLRSMTFPGIAGIVFRAEQAVVAGSIIIGMNAKMSRGTTNIVRTGIGIGALGIRAAFEFTVDATAVSSDVVAVVALFAGLHDSISAAVTFAAGILHRTAETMFVETQNMGVVPIDDTA